MAIGIGLIPVANEGWLDTRTGIDSDGWVGITRHAPTTLRLSEGSTLIRARSSESIEDEAVAAPRLSRKESTGASTLQASAATSGATIDGSVMRDLTVIAQPIVCVQGAA